VELLDRPHDLYNTATDEARKMLNKAIFTRLYLDSTDRRPTATAATLSEPFASLVHATRATTGTKTPQAVTATTHNSADTPDAATNPSDLLACAFAGQSASKASMVDLRARDRRGPVRPWLGPAYNAEGRACRSSTTCGSSSAGTTARQARPRTTALTVPVTTTTQLPPRVSEGTERDRHYPDTAPRFPVV
jgi:hypothetical protein